MLKILKIEVTVFQQNCRILACTDTKKAVVVDPGGDVNKIMGMLTVEGLKCEQIWLTHSHIDHCGGVAQLKKKTGAKLYGHTAGKGMRLTVEKMAKAFGVFDNSMRDCPEPEIYIKDRDVLSIGEHEWRVAFTPGHSPDHVTFYNWQKGVLLAGDTLFAGTIGRTDLPGGDLDTLMDSIRGRILSLPPETIVMPGHGPDTSVLKESDSNPFIVEDKKHG